MERKRFLIGCFLLGILLLLVVLIIFLQERRAADLFKQELSDDTLVDHTAVWPTLSLEPGDLDNETAKAESTIEKSLKSEGNQEPVRGMESMIDNKDQQDVEKQEAEMETVGQNMLNSFYYEQLTQEIKDRIDGKSYGKNCDIPYEELRYVKVLHWGFDGQTHSGEMIVNKAIAEDVIEIFSELYEEKYPIERMVLVDEYDADDNTSMAANNSSAFNYRVIEGTKRISLHSYGMAIDINPLYNPYVHVVDGERVVTPVEGAKYEDRSLDCPYYIHAEDVCYQAFIKRGFTWGGEWKNNKDYQHFQKILPVD